MFSTEVCIRMIFTALRVEHMNLLAGILQEFQGSDFMPGGCGLLGVRSANSLTRWGWGEGGEGSAHAIVLLPGEGRGCPSLV